MDPRPRKTTIETFNDELAVLDRPLENDVEYYDEKPPSRWPKITSVLFGVVVIGAASGLVFVKMRSSNAAPAQAAAPAPAVATPSAPIAVAPAPAPTPVAAPTPAAEETDEASVDEPAEAPAADEAAPRAPSRAAWTKIRTKSVHTKHARSGGGGKVVYRRTTTVKRHVVVKRTVAGRR